MTYLLSFIIISNNVLITLPLTVHGSLQTCETARVKLIKEVKRDYKDALITSVCLDR